MCIRDRDHRLLEVLLGEESFVLGLQVAAPGHGILERLPRLCLLYTSDAADDLLCVDLGGRRIIQKKTTQHRLT